MAIRVFTRQNGTRVPRRAIGKEIVWRGALSTPVMTLDAASRSVAVNAD